MVQDFDKILKTRAKKLAKIYKARSYLLLKLAHQQWTNSDHIRWEKLENSYKELVELDDAK